MNTLICTVIPITRLYKIIGIFCCHGLWETDVFKNIWSKKVYRIWLKSAKLNSYEIYPLIFLRHFCEEKMQYLWYIFLTGALYT